MWPVGGKSTTLRYVLAGLLLAGLHVPCVASDDWDWDAVDAMDDGPVTGNPVAGSTAGALALDKPRLNADTSEPDFTAPPVPAIALFRGVPSFQVIQSQRDAEMHPCKNCHQWVVSNPEPRKLKTPHDNFELRHGLHGHGKFWCFTCHRNDKDLGLKTLEGQPVDFADAYVVCSQCHARQAHDWAHGAHGKRVGSWQGARQVLNCTACHYQHDPAYKPREPMGGPSMRAGLSRPGHWTTRTARDEHQAEPGGTWQGEIRSRRAAGEHAHVPTTAAEQQTGGLDEES